MTASLQWFGTATWRLIVDGYVLWLDAYVARAPTAAPPPEPVDSIDRAHAILVGHSHFDHIADAGTIARRTGAAVVGSAHTASILADEGVLDSNVTICEGGELLQLGPVSVRVYRSLHGFNALGPDSPFKEWPDPEGRRREERTALLRERDPEALAGAFAHFRNVPPKQMADGGPLAFLLEWDALRLFWHDTPGMVTESWGAVAQLQPDVAILAAAGGFSTPNVDGRPFEAGQQAFVGHMAGILQAPRVILNHHDDWCPPITFHLAEDSFLPHLPDGVTLERHGLGEEFRLR